jgi:Asp-tRNA(Asn)/Glu-tRNA(Gln) amidotransferase A subunit family amidase
MALCWSLDKVGPICRHVEDLGIVLSVINGASPLDPSSVTLPLHPGIGMSGHGLTVGIDPTWFQGHADAELFQTARRALERSGATFKTIEMPDLPWDSLYGILTAEATAAFESLTRSDNDDQLTWQSPEAWPNTFRQAWFIPAPEYVQLQRFRRQVMENLPRVVVLIGHLFDEGTLLRLGGELERRTWSTQRPPIGST